MKSATAQLGFIIGGVILAAVTAAIGAYIYDNKKSSKSSRGGRPRLDPSIKNLQKIRDQLGLDFDPKDPNDPLAAIIAAGEYFRAPGCEPGGPHYEETLKRVMDMVESMVPPGRIGFWQEQVYRLYGSKHLNKDKS